MDSKKHTKNTTTDEKDENMMQPDRYLPRKGSPFSETVIYILICTFVIVILHFFIVENVMFGRLMPTLVNYIESSTISAATKNTILNNYEFIKTVIRGLVATLWMFLVIYFIVRIFKTEQQSIYG